MDEIRASQLWQIMSHLPAVSREELDYAIAEYAKTVPFSTPQVVEMLANSTERQIIHALGRYLDQYLVQQRTSERTSFRPFATQRTTPHLHLTQPRQPGMQIWEINSHSASTLTEGNHQVRVHVQEWIWQPARPREVTLHIHSNFNGFEIVDNQLIIGGLHARGIVDEWRMRGDEGDRITLRVPFENHEVHQQCNEGEDFARPRQTLVLWVRSGTLSETVRELVERRRLQRGFFDGLRDRLGRKAEHNIPQLCRGCRNLHGEVYGGNLLVCAMHPYGNGDECKDFKDRNSEA